MTSRYANLDLAVAAVRTRLMRLVHDDMDLAERMVLGQQIAADVALIRDIAQPFPAAPGREVERG